MFNHPVKIKFYFRKNSLVRFKSNDRSIYFCTADFFDRGTSFALSLSNGFALRIFLFVDTTVFVHNNFAVNRKSVYYRSAYTVKTSGNFISSTLAKFSSSMESGHNSFQSRNFCLFMNIYWNTTAIVRHAYSISRQESYLNFVSKTTHGFVSSIIKNFPNEMMKAVRTGCTDVHSGAFS